MAADVGRHVVTTGFALQQLHGREHRALRAADAKARRAIRHGAAQELQGALFGGGEPFGRGGNGRGRIEENADARRRCSQGGVLAHCHLAASQRVGQLAFGGDETGAVGMPIDQAMLTRLSGVIADATAAFDELDYARALERTESFFWWFCDDYVELVKTRAYGAGGVDGIPASGDVAKDSLSARNALTQALSVLQRLFAPHMPFCTDEVWSWWHDTSVHRAAWPSRVEVDASGSDTSDADNTSHAEFFLATVGSVLSEIRRCKTEAKVSQRAVVSHVVVACDDARAAAITQARVDLINAGNVADFAITTGDSLAVTVTLAPAS